MQGQEATELISIAKSSIGIDVSKDWLDVHVSPSGDLFRVGNDKAGIAALKRRLARFEIACVALEPTGKWHRQLWRSLVASRIPAVVVDPYRVRMFAKAKGILAKTDKLDARVLSSFAAVMGPARRPPPSEAVDAIAELVTARESAVAEQTRLKNQRAAATLSFLDVQFEERLQYIAGVIAALEQEIERSVKAKPELSERYAILLSIPGIGPVTAATLIGCLSELGSLTDKEITMLAGLAPIADQSGQRDGKRSVRGGRSHIRRALYCAALSAARYNKPLRAFYTHLTDNGKAAKCALIAVARKLLLLASTLLAQNRKWQPIAPKAA